MSYQQVRTTGQVHRLNEYIPNYQPHSEYLPTNRVLDANQPEAQKWVTFPLCSSPTTNNKRDSDTSTPNVPSNSIPLATFQCALSKT